jgi:hypothetical protein
MNAKAGSGGAAMPAVGFSGPSQGGSIMSGAELKKLEGEILELRAKIAGKEKEIRS